MKPFLLTLFFLLPLLASGQWPYVEVAEAIGVSDTISGHPWPNVPFLGGGVSAVDFNGDGWDDLTIATGINRDVLFYVNNGDGTFTKIPPLVDNTTNTRAVLWADIDNDGDKDLFISAVEAPDRLYENLGDLNLVDITEQAGLIIENARSYGAAFGDYNRDGFLDLYVGIRENKDFPNRFYRNNGDNTFTEIGWETNTHDNFQLTHQMIFADYNNDGEQDIYIANDRMFGNTMLINDGNGHFDDISETSGTGIVIDAMNVGTGDFNHDGYMDLFVTNNASSDLTISGNVLLRNDGDLTFSNITDEADVNDNLFCWAGNFFDFDNDKDLDLYVSSQTEFPWSPNLLYMNMFYPAGVEDYNKPWPAGFPNDTGPSYSNAIFDFNLDGKPDIVVPNNKSFPIQIWKNVHNNPNNYLSFTLEGVVSNLDAVGTTIEVYLGNDYLKRYKFCGDAYLAQNSDRIHFGLGTATMVDSVVVTWLSGIQDRYYNIAANQSIHLVENASHILPVRVKTTPPSCRGGSDGTAEVSIRYGTPPFTVQWSNDSTGMNLSNLSAGTYVVTVTGADSLTGVTVATILETPPFNVSLAPTHESNGQDGAVSLALAGGTAPYMYLWSNGSETQEISGLTAGVYQVTVTDAKGCTASAFTAVYNENLCGSFIPLEVSTTVNSAVLRWESVPGAMEYQVRYRVMGEDVWMETPAVTNSEKHMLALDTATTYEYQTRCFCMAGESDWSESATFTTLAEGAGACDTWEPLTIVTNNVLSVIQWDPQPEASLYKLRFRKQGTSDPWDERESYYPLHTVSPLQNLTTYEFQTATQCPYGWTEWSDELFLMYTHPDFTINTPFGETQGKAAQETFAVDPSAAFQVWPNPTADWVQISREGQEKAWLLLLNQQGQTIQQLPWESDFQRLDLTKYAVGSYWVVLVEADGRVSSKQVVRIK